MFELVLVTSMIPSVHTGMWFCEAVVLAHVSGSSELTSRKENGWEESGMEREAPGTKQALSQMSPTGSHTALCCSGRTGQNATWGGWAVTGVSGQPLVAQISIRSSSDSLLPSLGEDS